MEILKRGIDVSTWQGDIDWKAVKDSGIEFAILRSSFGSPDPKQVDNKFHQNVQGCQAVGMSIGAYHYGYSVSVEQAKGEAQFFLDTIKGISFDYPVYYDVEDNKTMGTLSKQSLTDVVNAFCKVVADAGYRIGVYSSTSWLENKMDMSQISYPVWCAQYYKECQYTGTYGIWQNTSDGQVNGINARCDMNYAYVDYTKGNSVVPIPTPSPVVVPIAPQPVAVDTQDSYTVVSGDTLSGIASKFGTTYQELARINNISNSNLISVGQVIKLKGNASIPVVAPVSNSQTYTVQSGDTLSGIANKYNTTYQELARINGISNPNLISVGQVLKVNGSASDPAPVSTPSYKTYTVQSGDSLWGIASRQLGNGSRYGEIKSLNGLSSDTIYPNQVLKMPN